jgi:hypothetical protein
MISAYTLVNQDVEIGGLLDFDTNRIATGCTVKHVDGTPAFTLTKPGYYYITFNGTITDTAAGNVTVELLNGGVAVPGAEASTTIAAITDERTVAFATIIRVLPSCCAIDNTTTLTVANTGVAATYSVANINITKLC